MVKEEVFHSMKNSDFRFILLYCTLCFILQLKIVFFLVIRTLATFFVKNRRTLATLISKISNLLQAFLKISVLLLSFEFTMKFSGILTNKAISYLLHQILFHLTA